MAFRNDFLPWALGNGANVTPQDQYAATPGRTAGVVAGTADPALYNKAQRQSAAIAAVIAQFTSDYAAVDVVDDGNLANLEAQFVRALRASLGNLFASLPFLTDAGAPNALAFDLEPPPAAWAVPLSFLGLVAPANTNTQRQVTAALAHVNATVPVVKRDGSLPQIGDIQGGGLFLFAFDGAALRIVGLLPSDFLSALEKVGLAFPEMLTADNRFLIQTAQGSATIATGQPWIHRGAGVRNTTSYPAAARTFALAPNKIYHLRWRFPADLFVLMDLIDQGYNPGALPQYSSAFDATLDDMIIATITTDGNANPTVTALKNKDRLTTVQGRATGGWFGSGVAGITDYYTINWARQPTIVSYRSFSSNVTTGQDGEWQLWLNALSRETIGMGISVAGPTGSDWYAPLYQINASA